MKKLLIILWIGCSYLAFSQSDTLNRTDKFGKKYGYWKKYDTNNKLEYEGMFYNGEPIGTITYYHPNGKIKNISQFTVNSPIVNTSMYYENGSVLAEGVFYNKSKDGKWLYYNPSGKLVMEEYYIKGKKNNTSKIYSSKGIILEETKWLDDKKNGISINYYTNGKLRSKIFYTNDTMHGTFENYYEDGTIKIKGQYAKDYRNGEWTHYNEKGLVTKIEYFDMGMLKNIYLGFRTQKEWITLNANLIAHFHQKTAKTVVIQLRDSTKITVYDNLLRISKCATIEYFIFINESVLSAYDVIKHMYPNKNNPNEAKVILLYPTDFDIITHDDYYKMLKSITNPKLPKFE